MILHRPFGLLALSGGTSRLREAESTMGTLEDAEVESCECSAVSAASSMPSSRRPGIKYDLVRCELGGLWNDQYCTSLSSSIAR